MVWIGGGVVVRDGDIGGDEGTAMQDDWAHLHNGVW